MPNTRESAREGIGGQAKSARLIARCLLVWREPHPSVARKSAEGPEVVRPLQGHRPTTHFRSRPAPPSCAWVTLRAQGGRG